MVSYAIVTHYIRRDLDDPLRFFEVLRPVHLYYAAPYNDMRTEEMMRAQQFRTPFDLYRKLRRLNPDIVQGGEPFVRRLVPFALAVHRYTRANQRPLVVPSADNLAIPGKYGPLWSTALRAAVRGYVHDACLDIALNKGAEQNLLWAGADPNRTVRMMYGTWGVDTAEFSPDGPRAELPGEGPVIMFLGRIERFKGVFDLLEAFERVADKTPARLVYVGGGPDAAELQQTVDRARHGAHVHMLGTVMNQDVPRYLRAATVLAAPSQTTPRWAEQVGMSAIQALACGVPVVTTSSGSIPEFIDDGVGGIVVPERDPPALAAALLRLLTDERARLEFSRRARNEAMGRFDARANIRAAERRILAACGRTVD